MREIELNSEISAEEVFDLGNVNYKLVETFDSRGMSEKEAIYAFLDICGIPNKDVSFTGEISAIISHPNYDHHILLRVMSNFQVHIIRAEAINKHHTQVA